MGHPYDEAMDDLDAVRAENATLRARVAAQDEKIAALEADGRRLDWLEKSPACVWFWNSPDERPSYYAAGEAPDDGPLGLGRTAREAIDAAMRESD